MNLWRFSTRHHSLGTSSDHHHVLSSEEIPDQPPSDMADGGRRFEGCGCTLDGAADLEGGC
jgi:hypothetical protein